MSIVNWSIKFVEPKKLLRCNLLKYANRGLRTMCQNVLDSIANCSISMTCSSEDHFATHCSNSLLPTPCPRHDMKYVKVFLFAKSCLRHCLFPVHRYL